MFPRANAHAHWKSLNVVVLMNGSLKYVIYDFLNIDDYIRMRNISPSQYMHPLIAQDYRVPRHHCISVLEKRHLILVDPTRDRT